MTVDLLVNSPYIRHILVHNSLVMEDYAACGGLMTRYQKILKK